MKATIITGSPHKNGTSAMLADSFIRGLEEAGHDVFRYDAAFGKVGGCLGCDHCRKTGEPCVRHDDMEKLIAHLLESDAVAFVTPVYYFGMSSQLKAVLDRFYASEDRLRGKKKAVLLASAASSERSVAKNLVGLYRDVVDWMQWENSGEVLALGCGARKDIEKSDYPEEAHFLGKRLFQQ